jgi:subtilase family serine protease
MSVGSRRGVVLSIAILGSVVAACGTGAEAPRSTSTQRSVLRASCRPDAPCPLTPKAFRAAYDIQPLLDRGIGGRAETVVLLERVASAGPPPDTTNIDKDMAAYDSRFGLPRAHLSFLTSLASPATAQQADKEEVMDAEIVHVVAPAASIAIVLVGAPANELSPLDEALRIGIAHGAVVSLSGAWGEHCFSSSEVSDLHSVLVAAEGRHVTVIASSGDLGAASEPCPGAAFTPIKEANLPASDPLVLSVGGTSLNAGRQTGKYLGETAWNAGRGSASVHLQLDEASSGGFSRLFTRPNYQQGVAGIGNMRGVPDVSADSGTTNLAVVVSYGGHIGTFSAGGTSASAPFWAGLVALEG